MDRESVVSVDIFPMPGQPLVLHRPSFDDGKDTLLLQWALPLLLSNLSIDQVLQILALLLIEMKVIVVCDQLSHVTSTTLGLASLLQPLSWAGPLITVLPPFLHEYMEVWNLLSIHVPHESDESHVRILFRLCAGSRPADLRD
jgi:hypothetical protein